MIERTLAIIKPDAIRKGCIGEILKMIEEGNFKILAMKMLNLTKKQAEGFYYVHREKFFFHSLVEFMTSGSVVVLLLEGENAIENLRNLMGPTDSKKAPSTTIRGKFGVDIEKNAIHGSDSPQSASFEISYMFSGMEIN